MISPSPWIAKISIVKTFHARENTHVYVNKKPETIPNPKIKTEKRINCREKLSLVARVQPAVSHATFNSSSIVYLTRDDLVHKKIIMRLLSLQLQLGPKRSSWTLLLDGQSGPCSTNILRRHLQRRRLTSAPMVLRRRTSRFSQQPSMTAR